MHLPPVIRFHDQTDQQPTPTTVKHNKLSTLPYKTYLPCVLTSNQPTYELQQQTPTPTGINTHTLTQKPSVCLCGGREAPSPSLSDQIQRTGWRHPYLWYGVLRGL